jgi:hypothetical protein
MTVSMMCLSFKEPIIALRLAKDNVGVTLAGVIISLDTITYTACSFALNLFKEVDNGKFYGRLQYYGCLVYVLCMLLQGPAPFFADKIWILCCGVAVGGIGGALIHNNSSPAMFLTEKAV